MRNRLAYYGFRFAAALFSLFPEPWMRATGEWLGRKAATRNPARRSLLEGHMRRVLGSGTSTSEVASTVDRMYALYGRYWAETIWLRPRRHEAMAARVERIGFEHISAALERGRGVIFALPHLGNWEVAGLVADEIGARVLAVAEDLPNPRLTQWFVDVRNHLGIDIVLTTDPRRRSKLIQRLKDGKAVALLADRDVTGGGTTTEFFGEETSMPSGPVSLALLTGATLLPVGVSFKNGAGHRIVVHPPIDVSDRGTREETVAGGVAAMARKFEEIISPDPAQWHLFQPNWPSDEGYQA